MNRSKRTSRTRFKAFALTGLTLFAVMAGCSSEGAPEHSAQTNQALSANAGDILGFEVSTDWHVTSSPALALSSSTTHTQGAHSLSVAAKNYVSIQSVPISVGSAIIGPMSYDLLLPPPANPFWAGATQLFVNCPSHNLFNQNVGQTELTGLPTGKFTTIQMPLPSAIAAGLSKGCSDLSLTVVLNVSFNQTGNYLIDNLQLDGPPTTNSCGTVPARATDAGVTETTTTFASTLVRPDVGTFTFKASLAAGSPTNETYAVTLNGQPLYEITQQGMAGGGSTQSDTYFPPITGVHQVTSISDGTNITSVVDGRATVPMPLTASGSSVKFVDGAPPPALTIPVAIGDAIIELFNDMAAKLPSCAPVGAPAATPLSTPVVDAVGTDQGHPSQVDGSACTTGEVACALAEGGCLAVSVGVDIACGPFAFICAPLTGASCIGAYVGCLGFVHRSGTDCCPVDCGGGSQLTNTIGSCCEGGESCLKRSTSGHVALCCSSGQNACGGVECCGVDTTCMPVQGGRACCKPSQINSAGQCCPGGFGTNGQCCFLGSCTTAAQCGGSNGCVNGCCIIG
jgi:hypothetical protein